MLIGKASGTNPISRYGGLQHHGAGVLLTGSEPASPLYFKKYKPAVMTPQQLDHQAVFVWLGLFGASLCCLSLAGFSVLCFAFVGFASLHTGQVHSYILLSPVQLRP